MFIFSTVWSDSMIRPLLLIVWGLLMTCTATAAQRFSCGGADVSISISARESSQWELRAESIVSVSKDGYSTVLRYRGNIDFIGGECVTKADSAPLVVYQAYCGGSGCNDGANWGVVETGMLRVLTVPNEVNRAETEQILGNGSLPRLKMMSVQQEARALGILNPVP
jgi:hypothetical protein